MLKFHRKSRDSFLLKRSLSAQTSAKNLKNNKSFQHTLFLPKTNFPAYLEPEKVNERDRRIQEECRFSEFYSWQRKHVKGKEFVLHDGPPYANGKPHIGHAINKILKDIILRSQAIQGCKLHFMPGWDCHGLPIEQVAMKNSDGPLTITELRRKAREVAIEMSENQKKAFQEWGVMADWNSQCYYTYDVKYIVNQLKMFWKMYERGYIYHDLKPVYWSPSSQTALAEAELLYNEHTSKALTVRFETNGQSSTEPLYLLIWTTTPWTVPLNAAVYFSPQLKYSVIKIPSLSGLYIIASDLIENLQGKLQEEIIKAYDISSDVLKKLQYKHPWQPERVLNVYESPKIKLTGTGLLHSVPGHGHEDFIMGLVNNLKVESFIDEKGRYTDNAGQILSGMNVLEEGSNAVIERLSSDVIHKEDYNHSYPYDWRTNEPVIIRASHQWFIDTSQLKGKALESLKHVRIPLEFFQNTLKNLPYWCLSRQRKWGVPIPAFFHKTSNRPLVSQNLIHHLCHLFEKFGPNIWWTGTHKDLFPDKFCREFFVKSEEVTKEEDIMDIWFDSGISWSYVLQGKTSDVCLEGVDQFRGWFQTSLLTSVATGNGAPFKRLLTHGFAVDGNGRKMSKSLGNVVDPETVLRGEKAFGVDTLRWFVGSHSQKNIIPVSHGILKTGHETVQKFRMIFRFLLGALNSAHPEVYSSDEKRNLRTFDTYMLNSCFKFYHSAMTGYNDFDIHSVCSEIMFFVPNQISSRYVGVVKDRLYCDERNSSRRKDCLYVLNAILNTLAHVVAPVLPHLAEEVFAYHPFYGKNHRRLFFVENPWRPSEWWENDSAEESIRLVDDIKKDILVEKNSSKMSCLIEVTESDYKLLKDMQNGENKSSDSELTEILQVADIYLKSGPARRIELSPTSAVQCLRCRRHVAPNNNNLCLRCEGIVESLGE